VEGLRLLRLDGQTTVNCSQQMDSEKRHARQIPRLQLAVFTNEPNYSDLSVLYDRIGKKYGNIFKNAELLNLSPTGTCICCL